MGEIKSSRDSVHEMKNWVAPESTMEDEDESKRLTKGDVKEVSGKTKIKTVRKRDVGRVKVAENIPGEKVKRDFQRIDELPDQNQLNPEDELIRRESESEDEQ